MVQEGHGFLQNFDGNGGSRFVLLSLFARANPWRLRPSLTRAQANRTLSLWVGLHSSRCRQSFGRSLIASTSSSAAERHPCKLASDVIRDAPENPGCDLFRMNTHGIFFSRFPPVVLVARSFDEALRIASGAEVVLLTPSCTLTLPDSACSYVPDYYSQAWADGGPHLCHWGFPRV